MFSSVFRPVLTARSSLHPYTTRDSLYALNQLNRFASRMAQELVSTAHQRGSSQIHLTEDDHQYLMKIHAPELSGHELTDLDLQIENEALILSIPALELPDLEGFTPVWEELVSEAQVKRIRIPRNIDFERVRATLCGDTLEVTLPKHAQMKRSITITQSKAS